MNLLPNSASAYLAERGVKLSAGSLRQYRYQGTGPAFIKIGGRVHYPVTSLDAYVAKVTSPLMTRTKATVSDAAESVTA